MENPFRARHGGITRRSFIKVGSFGLGFFAVGNPLLESVARAASGPVRRLVVLEMNGGNDGLNTVIPYGIGTYYDLRQRLGIPVNQVLHLDSTWGLHPALPLLKRRYDAGQVAILRGLGHPSPDLSHFAMMDFWRSGNLEGGARTNQTGWIGRLLDVIQDRSAPLAGLSLSSATGPALFGRDARVAAAESVDTGALDLPAGMAEIFPRALGQMARVDIDDSAILNASRTGMKGSAALSSFLSGLSQPSSSYPGTATGALLAFAARILAANDWIRIIHVPLPLDFDTHVDQVNRQTVNLSEIDGALEAFLKELESINLADQTVVVTNSEFGRRAGDNGGNGTDHGTANTMFVVGKKVRGGLYGDPPSLTQLDDNGNLRVTTSFLDLLATTVEGWMGAPASEVVPGGRVVNIFAP